MKKIINNLRNQPEDTRRHILHIITFGFGIILIIIWIYSLGRTVTSTETKTQIQQDLKPFTMLKDTIVNNSDNEN
ncbi:MAG: hypothetical protein WCO07_00435 [bacterium]